MIVPGIPFVQGANDYDDRDGVKFGIAIHNTSNDATDSGEASYATWRPDGTSSHLYADADSVTQSLDTDDKAGHAGSSTGNENAIAVEITGTNGKTRDWWLANVAWDKLGQVLAAIIRHHWPDGSFQVRRASVAEMKASPKVKAFYAHDDMRLAWGGTTHTDPGPDFPWDRLFTAVTTALGGTAATEEDDMIGFAKDDNGKLRKSIGGITWPCTEQEMGDIRSLSTQGVLGPASAKVHPNDAAGTAFGYPIERLVDDIAKRVVELQPAGGAGVTAADVRKLIVDTHLTPPTAA